MKKQLLSALGLLCYLAVISFLFRFSWVVLFKPKPFISVVLGMLILTVCQYHRQCTKEDISASLRWNLILASFLTTLVSILSATASGLAVKYTWQMADCVLPLLYGSLLYFLLDMILKDHTDRKAGRPPADTTLQDLMSITITDQVFRAFELTNRECHVALKLLRNDPNKEIAAELYISEATVKKHIQNIYHKFSATDRSHFKEIYFQYAQKIINAD